jgi:transcription antitermination factor NusA-like protein
LQQNRGLSLFLALSGRLLPSTIPRANLLIAPWKEFKIRTIFLKTLSAELKQSRYNVMKLPICSFDAKVGVLCPKCEEKLRSGELTRTDVDISFALSKLSSKMPGMERMTLRRAFAVDGEIVLLLGQGDMSAIRSNQKLASSIQEAIGRRVWMTEAESNDRHFVESLLFPARIMTMNTVFVPDGSRIMKVIIPGKRTQKFPVDLEKVKSIVKQTRGIDLVVRFEH